MKILFFRTYARTWILLSAAMAITAGCATAGRHADGGAGIAEILRLRARSNAAIAAKDVGDVVDVMVADIVVIGGNGGASVGRDSSRASFTRQFADPKFLVYTRTPVRIQESSERPLAAENGEWVGRWREADGMRELRGTYLAMWRHGPDGWKIRSELFVTLSCTGSSACAHAP